MSSIVLVLSATTALASDTSSDDSAGSTTLSFSEDFEVRYWIDDRRLPDPSDVAVYNYVEQVNRLNAVAAWDKWNVALQVDEVALFANRFRLDDVLMVERPLTVPDLPNIFPESSDVYVNIEKIRVGHETSWGTLEFGDTYVAFGRGIALNMNRNVDIDLDTSIQGVKGLYRSGPWDVLAVVGQANRQQVFQDNPNIDIFGDARHNIGGVRVERFGLGAANIGAHAVAYDFVQSTGLDSGFVDRGAGLDALVGGATAEFVGVGGADWFIEADLFSYDHEFARPADDDTGDLGYGVYASSSFYPGPLVFLVEGKRYYQTERLNGVLTQELYEVATAPTLEYERVINEDTSASVNSQDIWGGRVRMDWSARPGELVPYVSMAVFRDLDTTGLHFNDVPETSFHPVVGVEWVKDHVGLIANAGYRVDQRDGTAAGADKQLAGDLSFNFPVAGKLGGYIGAQFEKFEWGINANQQTDFIETETGVTASWGSKAALTWYTDYTTNPLVAADSTGNLSETLYGALEFQVKPTDEWTIKAFYGAQKAGIRCSGGQCRQLPGFEGGRLSVTGTF